jgi:hypothetical protein
MVCASRSEASSACATGIIRISKEMLIAVEILRINMDNMLQLLGRGISQTLIDHAKALMILFLAISIENGSHLT